MNRLQSPVLRPLVLGGAFLAATLLAVLPLPRPVHAEQPAVVRIAQADAAAQKAAVEAAREAAAAAREAAKAARDAVREATRAHQGATIDIELPEPDARDAGGKGINVKVDGMDRQYASFDDFLDKDPGLAAMVFGVVFIVFLTPILFTALVIWYKMRKARMANDTMLKLAEKGIVASPDAIDALHAGREVPTTALLPATAPLVEQARSVRQRAAWSDLRKGVIMGAIGLALTVYSLADGEANWIGLVLLFVGIGYGVLWFFESRNAPPAPPAPGLPLPPRSGDTAN